MFGTIDVEWRRLRLPFAVCIAAALAGGAAVAAAWRHEHRITEGMEATEARLAETRGRYSALAEERRKWRRFGPLYRRLAAHGRLGEEQPVRWTEAVRRAATGALAARYRLASPHVVERSGPVEVRATDMSIDLDLRHEAELPVFIAALEREAPGLFTVSGCRLVRTEATRAEPPLPAAVGAACRIRWQSVVLAGVEPGWTPAAGTQDGDDAGDDAGNDAGDDAGAGPAGARRDLAEPTWETFGRLFTTVAQRAAIESAQAARDAATQAAEIPDAPPARSEPPPPRPARWVRVGGVVVRSGRSVFAWIDGRRVAYGDARSAGAPLASPGPPGVRLDAAGRSLPSRHGRPSAGCSRPLRNAPRVRGTRQSNRPRLPGMRQRKRPRSRTRPRPGPNRRRRGRPAGFGSGTRATGRESGSGTRSPSGSGRTATSIGRSTATPPRSSWWMVEATSRP